MIDKYYFPGKSAEDENMISNMINNQHNISGIKQEETKKTSDDNMKNETKNMRNDKMMNIQGETKKILNDEMSNIKNETKEYYTS